LSACTNCGTELLTGALYCPNCGARAVDFSLPQTDVSPSHFNAGMTATAQPQTTAAPEVAGFASPPFPFPEEKKRSTLSGRGKLMVAIIGILVVLLVGATFEAGILGVSAGGSPAINSPSTALSGQQLYAAYSANQSQAAASYTNKTLYIRDSLDFGVNQDFSGQYFSSINSGTVILIWNTQAQVSQLYPGSVVLAKCSVQGLQASQGGYLLYLQGCNLVSVQTQTSTSSTFSVPSNNL
jgi:hypothetical protein